MKDRVGKWIFQNKRVCLAFYQTVNSIQLKGASTDKQKNATDKETNAHASYTENNGM